MSHSTAHASNGRLAQTFARCQQAGRPALVGYLTAFDPDLERSRERILAACAAGLDVLELGVAFSDPSADGPTIQAAMTRACAAGSNLEQVIALAAEIRTAHPQLPIVLFSYANPWLHGDSDPRGLLQRAAQCGVDALLVVDIPPEHAEPLRSLARAEGLDWIGLVAPTSSPQRIAKICAGSSGFVYAVSLTGVTGTSLTLGNAETDAKIAAQLGEIRSHTQLPIALGFGIRTPEQAAALRGRVEGVVVGSELVGVSLQGADALAQRVSAFAAALATG